MAILIDTFASISFISSLDVAEKRRKQRSGVLPALVIICSHKACFREVVGNHVPYEKILAWNARSTDGYHLWGRGPCMLVSTLLKRFRPLLELDRALS